MSFLPEAKSLRFKKRNRINKLMPKKHKIDHEFGRSTKTLWTRIIEKSKSK